MSMPTETMETMTAKTAVGEEATAKPRKRRTSASSSAERELALEMIRRAKERGLDLTGPDGLLKQFARTVLEAALDEEMTEHLGRGRHERSVEGRAANTRNGTTVKTVVTDTVGPVEIEVPRDRDGSFEPVIVRKRRHRLNDVDSVVLSLYAKGLAGRGGREALARGAHGTEEPRGRGRVLPRVRRAEGAARRGRRGLAGGGRADVRHPPVFSQVGVSCWGWCRFVGLVIDSITTNHATRPSPRRRSMMLMPNSVLILLSRYQTMYSSSMPMNSSMVTPAKLRLWKNSCLRRPKNPSPDNAAAEGFFGRLK